MKNYFWLILIVLSAVSSGFPQKTFLLKEASKNFDVKIEVEKCEEDVCEGKGAIYLMRKNGKTAFQTIRMPNVFLELGGD